jgi:hypothetical protein
MTDTLNISLNGLYLGPVALVNLALAPQVETSPFHNSLQLHQQDAKLHLRHRLPPQKFHRDQNFEVELGVVLAASAIVFASPLATVPKEVTLLLLVQSAAAEQEEMAEPELILVAPSRDGNADLARPVDAAQQKALHDAVEQQEIKFIPIDEAHADMIDLVRSALLSGAHDEIDMPLDAEALLGVEFELPLELNFDADGLFYFRDVMNGEADFLFSQQSDFRAASVEISITDGALYLLDEDEEYLDAADGALEGGFSNVVIDLDKAEGFFSRLVVQLDNQAGEANLGIEIFVGAQVLVSADIVIQKADLMPDIDGVIDDQGGLPENEILSEEQDAPPLGAASILPDEDDLLNDLLPLQTDIV